MAEAWLGHSRSRASSRVTSSLESLEREAPAWARIQSLGTVGPLGPVESWDRVSLMFTVNTLTHAHTHTHTILLGLEVAGCQDRHQSKH